MKTCFQSRVLFYVCKIGPWQGKGWTKSIPTESQLREQVLPFFFSKESRNLGYIIALLSLKAFF